MAIFLSVLLTQKSDALEGFSFVAERALTNATPVCMTALGDRGLVVLDAKSNALQFFDPDLTPGRQVLLDKTSDLDADAVVDLAYNGQREEILALDGKRNAVYVLGVEGDLLDSVNLNVSGAGKLDDPTDLAVDNNGILYIADPGDHNVKAFTRQGIYLVTMQKALNREGKRPDFKPSGLALRPDGSLAVVDMAERCIQIFMRDGLHRYRVRLEGKFRSLQDLIIAKNGDYISMDRRQRRVYKWNNVGVLSTVFGTKGKGRGSFLSLAEIASDAKGQVIALDTKQLKLQSFALEKPCIAVGGATFPLIYHVLLQHIQHPDLKLVAMLPEGTVYFNPEKHELQLQQEDTETVFTDERLEQVSSACICDGLLYAFDRGNHTVFAFRIDNGELAFRFGGSGRQAGSLDDVVRMLPGAANTLYLADQDDTLVKVFSRDGIFSTSFGVKGVETDEGIGHLTDITWHQGNLAVLDGRRELVHIYDTSGRFLRNIQLALPDDGVELAAVDTDANDFLVLLDAKRARILIMDNNGEEVYRFGCRGKRKLDWKRPTSLTLLDDGTLRVFDNTKPPRVVEYLLQTPGPLSQAAMAIAQNDRHTTIKHLEPWLDALSTGTVDPSRENARGAAVAVRADLAFGGILSTLQRDVARTVLGQWVKANPESHDARLALAESFHKAKRLEDAISVLQAAPQGMGDARCAALLARYREELDDSGKAQSIVTIDSCEIPPLLPALSQTYHEQPVIVLTISNKGGKPTAPGVATFFAKAVMDDPTETPVPALPPFSTRSVTCRATFNRTVLSYVETTRLSAHVEVRCGKGQDLVKAETHVGFELHGRNSIDWKQEDMVACFVTTKDPDVQVFLRRALNAGEEQTIQADLDPHLFKALTLFDAMQSVDLYYAPDPAQPFNYSRLSGEGLVDYVQYPRETLARLSGDCDDLAVLYASLLEGAGVPTVLVTSPGHIFVAFMLKNGKQSVDALGIAHDRLVEHDGNVYVPVETALLGNPFVTAWRVAADTVIKHKADDAIGFIDLRKAWQHYKTVSLPPHSQQIPLPTQAVLGTLLRRELDALNLKQVEKRLAVYKRWLEREPENQSLLILLARSYGEVGVFDLAQEYADRAMAVSPTNQTVYQVLGNLAFMQNDYGTAAEWFVKADALGHSAAIQINLALTYLKDGKLIQARRAFAEAKKLDPDLVSGYPELVQLLE